MSANSWVNCSCEGMASCVRTWRAMMFLLACSRSITYSCTAWMRWTNRVWASKLRCSVGVNPSSRSSLRPFPTRKPAWLNRRKWLSRTNGSSASTMRNRLSVRICAATWVRVMMSILRLWCSTTMFNCCPSALSWNTLLNRRPQISAIRARKAAPIRGENPLCTELACMDRDCSAMAGHRENRRCADALQAFQGVPDLFSGSCGLYVIEPGSDASVRGNDERVATGEAENFEIEQTAVGAGNTSIGVGQQRKGQPVLAGKIGMRTCVIDADRDHNHVEFP